MSDIDLSSEDEDIVEFLSDIIVNILQDSLITCENDCCSGIEPDQKISELAFSIAEVFLAEYVLPRSAGIESLLEKVESLEQKLKKLDTNKKVIYATQSMIKKDYPNWNTFPESSKNVKITKISPNSPEEHGYYHGEKGGM